MALPAQASNGSEPFVVLELFTSQGCSSCPPADLYLKKVAERAREQNLRVYPLSFHVDYWDYLGWRDPFSSQQFTKRQRNYTNSFRIQSMYTPQMIVNGLYEFGGYKSNYADRLIREFLAQKPKTNLNFTTKRDANTLKINYLVKPVVENSILNFAIVQETTNNDVKSGENRGRKLAHANVVRTFKSIRNPTATGNIELNIPEGLDPSNTTVIGYIQHISGTPVFGANAKEL